MTQLQGAVTQSERVVRQLEGVVTQLQGLVWHINVLIVLAEATGTAGRLFEGLAAPSATPREKAASGRVGRVGFSLPLSGIARVDGLPSGGDVPRSPWPSKGVVQDLERLYRLRRKRSYASFSGPVR